MLNSYIHTFIAVADCGSFSSAAEKLFLSESAVYEARQISGNIKQVIRIGTSIMRPCNRFVESLSSLNLPYQFNIIPFNDDVDSLNTMLNRLGEKIDCFVSPGGSMTLLLNYGFLPISTCKCAITVPLT